MKSKPVTLYLKAELIDSAREYAEKKGLHISGVMNLALLEFFEVEKDGK